MERERGRQTDRQTEGQRQVVGIGTRGKAERGRGGRERERPGKAKREKG